MTDRQLPIGIAPQAWPYAIPMAVIALALGLVGWWTAAMVPAAVCLAVLAFFRDPERRTPNIPHSLCSPADGRVTAIEEVDCDHMPGGRALRVSIFLSIFDAHIQRSPVGGTVQSVERRPGRWLNAVVPRSAEENNAVTIWLNSDLGLVGVRQIVGLIARRIVCNAREGTILKRGERYGLIQFGSRVDLFLPTEARLKVTLGARVKAGQTCMAVVAEEEVKRGRSREMAPKVALPAEVV